MGRLTVAVVGAGGTGSAAAEQLTRLGVGRLLLIDDDVVSDTNVTRIHEVTAADVGRTKVAALGERLAGVGTGTMIEPIHGRITSVAVAESLRACDVVFGCTDDEAGRGILSRFAYQYRTPVIDLGFLIDSVDGDIRGLHGRITTMLPGIPCLFCRRRISPDRIAREAMGDRELAARVAEGYAPGLPDPDPAVVPYTTMVATLAVSEFIERIVGYDQPPPSELLVELHDRRISRSPAKPIPGHWCTDPAIWGQGDTSPFLGRAWAG